MLTAKLLNQGYRYHKLRKAFFKFYNYSNLVSKFNVGLKSLLQQGLSEPEFYGDLVYKFRKYMLAMTSITSFGEERANLSAFRTFVRFVLVWICRFPHPLGFWEGLRFMIVALPGLFSYLFFFSTQFRKISLRYKKIGYNINVLFVLRFYGPVNPMGSCRARSVYLTTHLLGRLSPLSG